MLQFDEGTGTNVADSIGSNDGTASASTVWASGGTFTYGTSTVNMTGDGDIDTIANAFSFYNLEVAQSGKTTTLWGPVNDQYISVYGTLTTGTGTFTDGAIRKNVYVYGSDAPVDGGSTFENIDRIVYITGTSNITSSVYNDLVSVSTTRYLLGDVNVTTDIEIQNNMLVSNGYNITTKTATVSFYL